VMKIQEYYSVDAIETSGLDAPILSEDPAFREFSNRRKHQRELARKMAKASVTSKKQRKMAGKKRRAKATPEMKWLKELICPFVYAEKTPVGVRPSVTKEAFIGRWNMGLGLPSLPNYKLLDHFQGKETLYFMAHGWAKIKRILVMIDIDVMKSLGLGTPEGARKFAEHLKTIWPDLYFEVSTNGKGIHGYFILLKRWADAKQTNAALKRLEAWLRAEAKKTNADIEQVEIKGTCLDLTLEDSLAQCVKFGVPAKLPRDVARFSEWQETTVLRVQDLERSQFDVNEAEVVVSAPDPVKVEPEEVIQWPTPKADAKIKKKETIVAGSVSNKFINEDELAAIPAFERLYREWVGPNDLMAGKFRVTAHDFAVAMVLLRHFKADPSWNGGLPVRRAGKLWKGLKDTGDTDRGWNHHRWKAIRDFLSARGHIDWTDHRYEIPTVVKDENGKKDQKKSKRGIACKWAITDQYDHWLERVALITAPNTGEASSVDTDCRNLVPPQGNGKNLRPVSCQLRQLRFLQRADAACDLLYAA
jgi:hypothetical protein